MAGKRGLDFLKTAAQYMTKDNGFDSLLKKVNIISGGEGRCTCEFTVAEEHLNSGGGLHGGCTATMVDIVTTLALMTNKHDPPPGVSTDIHVSYLNGARLGDKVTVEASTIKAGKNLAFLECLLKHSGNGKIIAKGLHTKFIGSN